MHHMSCIKTSRRAPSNSVFVSMSKAVPSVKRALYAGKMGQFGEPPGGASPIRRKHVRMCTRVKEGHSMGPDAPPSPPSRGFRSPRHGRGVFCSSSVFRGSAQEDRGRLELPEYFWRGNMLRDDPSGDTERRKGGLCHVGSSDPHPLPAELCRRW